MAKRCPKTRPKPKAKAKAMAKPARAPGRPSKYRPEFCEMLADHFDRGLSFESFGAECDCSKDTLYEWLKVHPAFSDAHKRALPLLHGFYEKMGQSMASGQMRRVVSEEPLLGPDNKPLYDPRTGQMMMRRTYEPAKVNPAAWIFLTKNMLGWRDKRDVNHGGQPDGTPVKVIGMTREERRGKIRELNRTFEECGDD